MTIRTKTLLIDPGSSFSEEGTRNILRQTPHIGLCSLAMSIKDIAEVEILDMPLTGTTEDNLIKKIEELDDHDIVGITCATFNLAEALHVAHTVKRINPNILTILGGPHVNADAGSIFRMSASVDLVAVGESELTLQKIVKFRQKEKNINTRILHGKIIPNLDNLPFPDWKFLHIDQYWKRYSLKFDKFFQIVPISGTRGCPFRCSFCDPCNLTNKIRHRSAESMYKEIENTLIGQQIQYFYLTDSVMTVPRVRFTRLFSKLQASGLDQKIAIIGQANIIAVDEILLDLFKAGGGEYIFFGIESGNEEVLRLNGKNLKLGKIRRIVKHAHDIGLYPRGSFILGLPFDTIETVGETIEFSRSLDLHSANYFALDIYPGTAAHRMLKKGEGGLEIVEEDAVLHMSRKKPKVKVNDLEPWRIEEFLGYARSLSDEDERNDERL